MPDLMLGANASCHFTVQVNAPALSLCYKSLICVETTYKEKSSLDGEFL